MSLVWLRDRLEDSGNPVSMSTLSYWRSGRRRPAGAASIAAIGGRFVRSLRHPSGIVTGYLVEMERPLPGGSTAMVEFVVEYPEGYPSNSECTHAVARRTREGVIWVRFDPDRVPDWCEEFTVDDDVLKVDLGSGSTVHAVRHGFGPGTFGIRWGFLDEPDCRADQSPTFA